MCWQIYMSVLENIQLLISTDIPFQIYMKHSTYTALKLEVPKTALYKYLYLL